VLVRTARDRSDIAYCAVIWCCALLREYSNDAKRDFVLNGYFQPYTQHDTLLFCSYFHCVRSVTCIAAEQIFTYLGDCGLSILSNYS
jgi:hypothetical protein